METSIKDFNLKEKINHGDVLYPLKIYNHQDPFSNFFVSYHWHEEIELVYVREGELDIKLNTTTHHAKAGQLYLINSEALHQIIGVTPSTHHAIVFSPNILSFETFDYSQSHYINPILKHNLKLPEIIDTNTDYGMKILNEYETILNEYNNREAGWYLNTKASLLRILAILARKELLISDNTMLDQEHHKIEMMKVIISYIEKHYASKITLDDLANCTNLNSQYFCRFFKSIIGKTPIEFVNQYRIDQAATLLEETDLKILNVCYETGFNNVSYFIKKFREYKGCLPSEFKEFIHNQLPS